MSLKPFWIKTSDASMHFLRSLLQLSTKLSRALNIFHSNFSSPSLLLLDESSLTLLLLYYLQCSIVIENFSISIEVRKFINRKSQLEFYKGGKAHAIRLRLVTMPKDLPLCLQSNLLPTNWTQLISLNWR